MVKVKVYIVPKKEFEKHYGKYAYGVSSTEEGAGIQLKSSIKSKKLIKGTIEHELGHLFSETRKITKKLPVREKKRLLEMYKEHEEYKRRGTISGKARMQEIIADLYGHSKSKNDYKKALQEGFPKTMKIIKKQRQKFKPKLIRKEW